MAQSARPLSPHLQVYKPQLTSTLSISHRVAGVISLMGSICLLLWITSVAWDSSIYSTLQNVALSIPIQILMFIWSMAIIYHLLNGIRHLFWDAGKGFEIPQIYTSGKIVLIAAVVVNILIWITR